MSEHHACSDADLISKVEGYEAFPHFIRLLVQSGPVRMDNLASAADRPDHEVEGFFRSQDSSEWDKQGRLVGFGLSLRPTQHHYFVAGRDFYTWCATDTLLFTVILQRPAVAVSSCPATNQTIRLEMSGDGVTSVTPKATVVSQAYNAEPIADLRGEICDHGHFFASPAAASHWAAEHPQGQILSVAEAFEQCRAMCEELGWVVPQPPAK